MQTKKRRWARVWAAIEKRTGEVWLINNRLGDLKADVGDDRRYRFAKLVESRKS